MSTLKPLTPAAVSVPAARPAGLGLVRPSPAAALRVVLVDPDRKNRALLSRALERAGVTIAAECGSSADALAAIRRHKPEAAFLEVALPDGSGFDLLAALAPAERPAAVFVTAHERDAARAFEADAADCVIRPFVSERISAAVMRARDRRRREAAGGARRPMEDFLLVKRDGRSILVRVAEIDWIESARNNVILHVGPERYVHHETTSGIEARLPSDRFLRIHRSTIVRLDRVKELVPWFHGDYRVTLRDGTTLTLSESYRDRLKRFRP